MLARGDVSFIVTIPADFERKLVRGERPAAPDRGRRHRSGGGRRTRSARSPRSSATRWRSETTGALAPAAAAAACRSMSSSTASTIRRASPPTTSCPACSASILHDDHDPDDGARAHPRGRARHDGEPARHAGAALEIMIGKIVPYIGFGFVQVAVILVAGRRCSSPCRSIGPLTVLLSVDAPLHRRQRDARLHHSRRSRAPRCRRCR